MQENLAERILRENNDFVGAKHLVDVEGMSTPKVCNLLNRLVAGLDPSECYLEIGTWKGLTLCSAAVGNPGKLVVGCDKFRFLGKFTGWGFLAKRAFYANVARYSRGGATVVMHAMTSERFFRGPAPEKPVGVYFYDGDHSYQGTKDGVTLAARWLAPRATVLVDDWRDPEIQRATRDGLREAGLEILWEREFVGATALDGQSDRTDWWNGLAVFYVEKRGRNGAAR